MPELPPLGCHVAVDAERLERTMRRSGYGAKVALERWSDMFLTRFADEVPRPLREFWPQGSERIQIEGVKIV